MKRFKEWFRHRILDKHYGWEEVEGSNSNLYYGHKCGGCNVILDFWR